MWYEIKQGRHRAYPLSLGIHTGKTQESYEVIFDDSCRYQLDEENQLDWNKLVGWSYGFHHKNSIRIGWRYNSKIDKIELVLYTYENGIRIIDESNICQVSINEKVTIKLEYYLDRGNVIRWKVKREDWPYPFIRGIHTSMIPKWGYNLGLYFGGNCTQPNKTMKVWIKKLKSY